MTYEDCMDLVEAYTASVELAVDEDLTQEQVQKVKSIRDYVGDFIGKLVHRGISGVSQEGG